MRASIAELSDELQQAKLERIENNILEFVEEQPSALPGVKFRTTLRGLDGGDAAFLRAQWSFLGNGGCIVTPASGRDSSMSLEAGGAGWRLMPAKVQGSTRDTPDIFECWCFVKDGDGQMTKVTLRTTSLPADDAALLPVHRSTFHGVFHAIDAACFRSCVSAMAWGFIDATLSPWPRRREAEQPSSLVGFHTATTNPTGTSGRRPSRRARATCSRACLYFWALWPCSWPSGFFSPSRSRLA